MDPHKLLDIGEAINTGNKFRVVLFARIDLGAVVVDALLAPGIEIERRKIEQSTIHLNIIAAAQRANELFDFALEVVVTDYFRFVVNECRGKTRCGLDHTVNGAAG